MRFLLVLLLASEAAAQPVPAGPTDDRPLMPPIVRDCPTEARRALAERGEIVVCGSRDARSPYRLPERRQFDPAGPAESVSRERHRLYEVGEGGIGSCSTVGPGGWTGCMARGWKRAREQYSK